MPTTGMLWIRSKAHRGENKGKRVMQIPPTQISPTSAFTEPAIMELQKEYQFPVT